MTRHEELCARYQKEKEMRVEIKKWNGKTYETETELNCAPAIGHVGVTSNLSSQLDLTKVDGEIEYINIYPDLITIAYSAKEID